MSIVGGKKNELGFLRGDVNYKFSSCYASFFDAINFIKTNDKENTISVKQIEMLPIANLRGRSFNNAFIMLHNYV